MRPQSGRVWRWWAGGAALAGAAACLWMAPVQGQQPTPSGLPAVATTVAGAPNPDGTFHVDYQFPLAALALLAGRPVLRVLNASGELAGLQPLRILEQGSLLAGYGDFRLPRGDPGPFVVQVEVPFLRPDGSTQVVVTAKPLARP